MSGIRTYGNTPRDFWRSADIQQAIQAAALAGSHYPPGEFQRGYMAALHVLAAALGVAGSGEDAVTIDVFPMFERPRNWRRE